MSSICDHFWCFPININMKTLFVIYKTTNIVNGKFYIGKHVMRDLNDDYLGSGLNLQKAIKKYGRKNFSRSILFVFDNETDMNDKEVKLITEDLVKSRDCYNIAMGGRGGNLGPIVNEKISKNTSLALKGKRKSDSHKLSLSKSNSKYKPSADTIDKITHSLQLYWSNLSSDERKEKQSRNGNQNGFYGKSHSDDSIKKMKNTIGDNRKGSKNPNSKSITLDGVTYSTRKECMESLKLNKKQFYKLLGEKNVA